MKVAIIGAGVSGLLSLKNSLDEDINAVCYEMTERIGKYWFVCTYMYVIPICMCIHSLQVVM